MTQESSCVNNFLCRTIRSLRIIPLESKRIMLMHWASARMFDEPCRNARSVKPTKTFESRHLRSNCELLETNCALCIIDTILFCREIRVHTRSASRRSRGRASAWSGVAISAVSLNARVDMRLPEGFEIWQRPGREFSVANWAFVFLSNLQSALHRMPTPSRPSSS